MEVGDFEEDSRLAALCSRLGRLCSAHGLEVWDDLVIFKPWVPNTPLHCYDFSTCAFWVQVYGRPLEWSSNQMLRKAVKHVGRVLEVKMDSREGSNFRSGRVRVEMDLQMPLKIGHLICIDGKTILLDFRYERLPHFCYSCGRLRHYAAYYSEVPFTEAKLAGKDKMAYGQWLRAEVKEHGPYWITFYGDQEQPTVTEEMVPETLPVLTIKAPALPPQ